MTTLFSDKTITPIEPARMRAQTSHAERRPETPSIKVDMDRFMNVSPYPIYLSE